MKIHDDIEIIDLGLKYKDVFILSDLHLGYEEAKMKEGLLLPRFQFKDIYERLEKIFAKIKVKKIIITGDLKHEFGIISEQEWRDIRKILSFLQEHGEVIVLKGNHDVNLSPIANKVDFKILERYDVDDITILHGDRIEEDLNDLIIIGHEHPSISFQGRPDKYKCFLKGKYKKHVLIVLPSFNPLIEGSDITKEKTLSPYLEDIKNFEIYIVEDKVYPKLKQGDTNISNSDDLSEALYFGKLKNLRST